MTEFSFCLEKTPLNSNKLLIDEFKRLNSSSKYKESSKIIKNESKLPEKPLNDYQFLKPKVSKNEKKDFPYDSGKLILKDTLHSESFMVRITQDMINENIKECIYSQQYAIKLEHLIKNYSVSISDLYLCKIINSFDDFKTLKFKASDLVINRELFNVSHLRQLYDIDYKTLIENDIVFNLLVIRKCEFTFDELCTLKFDFKTCFEHSLKIIQPKNIKNRFKKTPNDIKYEDVIKEYKRNLTEIFASNPPQISFKNLKYLGLEQQYLKILGITPNDIKRFENETDESI